MRAHRLLIPLAHTGSLNSPSSTQSGGALGELQDGFREFTSELRKDTTDVSAEMRENLRDANEKLGHNLSEVSTRVGEQLDAVSTKLETVTETVTTQLETARLESSQLSQRVGDASKAIASKAREHAAATAAELTQRVEKQLEQIGEIGVGVSGVINSSGVIDVIHSLESAVSDKKVGDKKGGISAERGAGGQSAASCDAGATSAAR